MIWSFMKGHPKMGAAPGANRGTVIKKAARPLRRKDSMIRLSGVYTVLPTPFDKNGAFDRASLGRVIDLFLEDGVSGFTALGVTSEVARLSDAERQSVLEATMEHVNGRVPVIVGATGSGLDTCLEYCRAAKDAGAAGVMVSPPRMPKLNSAYIHRHFAAIAEKFDFAIVVQDFPPISGYHMEASLLVDLCRKIPQARTIKLEDAPTPYKTARIRELEEGVGIDVFGGLGGGYLIEELIAGATGAMTGFAYPKLLVEVVSTWNAGKKDEAADFFYRHVPLMRFEFQEGIGMAIRKEMLKRRGALAHAGVRPPGATLDSSTKESLDRILKWLDLD
jgi:4-hydroxy-tetrahydrodipicolinate synthase